MTGIFIPIQNKPLEILVAKQSAYGVPVDHNGRFFLDQRNGKLHVHFLVPAAAFIRFAAHAHHALPVRPERSRIFGVNRCRRRVMTPRTAIHASPVTAAGMRWLAPCGDWLCLRRRIGGLALARAGIATGKGWLRRRGLSSSAAGLPCAGRERGRMLAAPLAFAPGCGRLVHSRSRWRWRCCRALRRSRQQRLGRRCLPGGRNCSGSSLARPLCTALAIRSGYAWRMHIPGRVLPARSS